MTRRSATHRPRRSLCDATPANNGRGNAGVVRRSDPTWKISCLIKRDRSGAEVSAGVQGRFVWIRIGGDHRAELERAIGDCAREHGGVAVGSPSVATHPAKGRSTTCLEASNAWLLEPMAVHGKGWTSPVPSTKLSTPSTRLLFTRSSSSSMVRPGALDHGESRPRITAVTLDGMRTNAD